MTTQTKCTNCGTYLFSNKTVIDGKCGLCYVTDAAGMACCGGDLDHGVVEHRHSCPVLADKRRMYA